MSRLGNLLREVEQLDTQLAQDLVDEVRELRARRAFGLNFERHTPETVELPGRPVRKGDKVHVLAPRDQGKATALDKRLWRVQRVETVDRQRMAHLVRLVQREDQPDERAVVSTDDLMVVAEFRDPIYPGLRSTDSVTRGGDKPFHAVINAENYHALQALMYTHEAKVDAIYIDPPYNTGARDWKYNNDYVDLDDQYRHSKWLAFMERRLRLARRLLNPDNSVLIVAIDEKEYLRLGLLLEQTFPGAQVQMVSVVINPSGTSRDLLSRVDEYLFFCFIGDAKPFDAPDDLLNDTDADGSKVGSHGVRWEWLLRGGGSWYRDKRPNLCYPVLLNEDKTRLVRAGSPLMGDNEEGRPSKIDGHPVVWPVRSDGRLGIWRVDSRKLNDLIGRGYAHVSSKPHAEQPSLRYLLAGTVEKIDSGELTVTGRGNRGEVLVAFPEGARSQRAKTVWRRGRHIAGGAGGAQLLNNLLGDRGRFQFPKSLYAVEDALRIAIGDKPNAIVLDYFSGSGTTAHAVMRLNREDGGRRQAIVVTNNEVSIDEQTALKARGLRAGDEDWEKYGICDYITKPRIKAAVTGLRADGSSVSGAYRFGSHFPMADGFEENVEFFSLTYETPRAVAHNRSFAAVAPLLWMKAGSVGRRIESSTRPFEVADVYGVLFDLDYSQDFIDNVHTAKDVGTAFIVTDDERAFQSVASALPRRTEVIRLYESYLTNFVINVGGK